MHNKQINGGQTILRCHVAGDEDLGSLCRQIGMMLKLGLKA